MCYNKTMETGAREAIGFCRKVGGLWETVINEAGLQSEDICADVERERTRIVDNSKTSNLGSTCLACSLAGW